MEMVKKTSEQQNKQVQAIDIEVLEFLEQLEKGEIEVIDNDIVLANLKKNLGL